MFIHRRLRGKRPRSMHECTGCLYLPRRTVYLYLLPVPLVFVLSLRNYFPREIRPRRQPPCLLCFYHSLLLLFLTLSFAIPTQLTESLRWIICKLQFTGSIRRKGSSERKIRVAGKCIYILYVHTYTRIHLIKASAVAKLSSEKMFLLHARRGETRETN